MDPETFAQARNGRLGDADDELEEFVRDALERLIAGDPDWTEDLVTAASVLWLELFKTEAPNADGATRLAKFQRQLELSLAETSSPGFEVTDGDVTRVGYWLAGFTVNDATVQGTQARGGRFKRWVSHHDDRVRHLHAEMDGQIVPATATFAVGGYHLHYPGEPVGPPEIWIQCRCLAMPAAMNGGAMSATTYQIGATDAVTYPGGAGGDVIEVDNPDIITSDDSGGAYAATTPTTDPTDIAVEPVDEADLVDDDPEDGEELVTEIPVHGVLAPEGVATGDGREFAIGALSTRDLPIPLRYETVGTHGGTTSDVVTVGRIDQAWRDDATDSWRFTGSVVLSKPFAQDVIDGIVDGTVRGVSIDGDDAEVEVQAVDGEGDILAQLMNPDKTVFSKMRVAGLTIVPIPAFQQAYIALGHDFQEDMTEEQQAEQMAALQACGCMSAEVVVSEDAVDARQALSDNTAGESGKAEDAQADPEGALARDAELASVIPEQSPEEPRRHTVGEISPVRLVTSAGPGFAPGTHDGPGWITHPIPTARIRRYWTKGKGAAKIGWGAPGDFDRCRRQLAKYVQNPDWLAGMCANMHHEALGFWPAQHHGSRVIIAAASTLASPIATLTPPAREVYPSAWFANPGLDHAMPLRAEKETRRIFGYISEWGVCHVGVAGFCQEVPASHSNYAYFLKGLVDTDTGTQPVGTLTWGGHASRFARIAAAAEFYDKPDAVRAFVNVGEDAHGIWFAGVVAPWCTDEDIDAIRGIGAVSGDWREIRGELELIGVPIVNSPGFPLRALAASAGRQITLIGAGALRPEPVLVASAGGATTIDPELVAGIARTAVAEYRHQEKVAARAEPIRTRVRERRIEAARNKAQRRD